MMWSPARRKPPRRNEKPVTKGWVSTKDRNDILASRIASASLCALTRCARHKTGSLASSVCWYTSINSVAHDDVLLCGARRLSKLPRTNRSIRAAPLFANSYSRLLDNKLKKNQLSSEAHDGSAYVRHCIEHRAAPNDR